MSDPIIDRLDQIKDRADKATEGPWEAEYSAEQGNCVLPPGYQSTREAVAVMRSWLQMRDAAVRAGIVMRETAEIIRDEIAVALGVETEGDES